VKASIFNTFFPWWIDGGPDIRISFPSTLAEYEGKRAYMYISRTFFVVVAMP
jgi:hypothetical protein